MRKVKYYEWYRPEDAAYNAPFEKREVGEAIFHEFGLDFEEFESGPANYSVAIVELASGEVKSVPVDLIAFVE